MNVRRLLGHFGLASLLCLTACRATSTEQPPAPIPNPVACQRKVTAEAEQIYIAQLSPLEEIMEGADVCFSQQTLKAARDAILADKSDRPAVPARRWDHKSAPKNLALIDRRFALNADEKQHISRDGFVISERLYDTDYVMALHEVFQSQLPLYVSADAILHAVYASNDKLLAQLEATLLAPRLDKLLEALQCQLAASSRELPAEVARDVDLYLTVARSLLADKEVSSLFGQEAPAKQLLDAIRSSSEFAERKLFGRSRMIDFSVYKPRGHYAPEAKEKNPNQADLSSYFRAVTWLSRIEWNIVTRSCVSSQHGPELFATPHEAAVAIALGRLISDAKVGDAVDSFDRAFTLLAGKREDVPLAKLAELATGAGITTLRDPQLSDKLKQAIGKSYVRTARTHYAWEGCTELPVISTMIGPRIVPDGAATRPLVHSETPERRIVHAADMAYALGHDRALNYLSDDLKQFPTLRANLDKARKLAHDVAGDALYNAWSTAILKLAEPATDAAALPSFMRSDAYADLRMNSAVAAFGQIRHNYVLMAAQTYDEGGCEIPDTFVEPVPAVYDALIAYAERGGTVLRALDPEDTTGGKSYFARLAQTLQILSVIARDELAQKPLSDAQKRFLGMVVEVTGSGRGTGGSPTFTGWYFDLFRDRRDAFTGADFIADYYTSSELQQVSYVGVSGVRMGIFVVDSGGEPRAFMGPVTRAYEHVGPLDKRLTDAEAVRLPDAARIDPWAATYSAKALPQPPITYVAHVKDRPDETRTQQVTLEVWSTRPLGPVTLELLDHHRRPLGRVTHPVGTAKTKFFFPKRAIVKGGEHFGYEGVHLRVGNFDDWQVGGIPDAQSGAPRRPIVEGSGHAYGGMPAVVEPVSIDPFDPFNTESEPR